VQKLDLVAKPSVGRWDLWRRAVLAR